MLMQQSSLKIQKLLSETRNSDLTNFPFMFTMPQTIGKYMSSSVLTTISLEEGKNTDGHGQSHLKRSGFSQSLQIANENSRLHFCQTSLIQCGLAILILIWKNYIDIDEQYILANVIKVIIKIYNILPLLWRNIIA